MPRGKRSIDPSSVNVNDLVKRLADIEKEETKLLEEREHIKATIRNMEAEKILKDLTFDKIVQFQHKKSTTFGKVTGLFKDSAQVSICNEKGSPIEQPEGTKRVRLVATVKLEEIQKIL